MSGARTNNSGQNDDGTLNPGVINLRLKLVEDAVKEGNAVTKAVLDKVNNMSYVATKDFEDFKDQVYGRIDAVQKLGEKTYRRKEDGKTARAIAVSVITALCITVATMVVLFVGRGIFNAQ